CSSRGVRAPSGRPRLVIGAGHRRLGCAAVELSERLLIPRAGRTQGLPCVHVCAGFSLGLAPSEVSSSLEGGFPCAPRSVTSASAVRSKPIAAWVWRRNLSGFGPTPNSKSFTRSEEHTSELQSRV